MREIPSTVTNIILDTLPLDITRAIYIFGSYGTINQHSDSDIDIAWFANKRISLIERTKYKLALERKLGLPVDLKPVQNYSPYMEHEMLEGDCIYCKKDFGEYIYNFMVNNEELLEIYKFQERWVNNED